MALTNIQHRYEHAQFMLDHWFDDEILIQKIEW